MAKGEFPDLFMACEALEYGYWEDVQYFRKERAKRARLQQLELKGSQQEEEEGRGRKQAKRMQGQPGPRRITKWQRLKAKVQRVLHQHERRMQAHQQLLGQGM